VTKFREQRFLLWLILRKDSIAIQMRNSDGFWVTPDDLRWKYSHCFMQPMIWVTWRMQIFENVLIRQPKPRRWSAVSSIFWKNPGIALRLLI